MPGARFVEPESATLSQARRRFGCVKVREVVRMLMADGWSLDRQRGSHRQFRHPDKPGTVTIAGKPGEDLKAGTLASILRQAGLGGRGR
jgi:predicted RNA binding protein YcfA (HicA-like mRNA interferase family)